MSIARRARNPGTSLGALNDVNNWLGRSQWVFDEEFAGTLHEFRIYSRALTPAEIVADNAAGPDNMPAPTPDGGPAPDGGPTPDGGPSPDASADVPATD